MEGKQSEPLVHDDTTLLFISDVLSYVISSKTTLEYELTTAEKYGDIEAGIKGHRGETRIASEDIAWQAGGAWQAGDTELFITDNEEEFLEKAKNILT